MTKTAFIWDFDGTLADSYEASLEALEQLHREYGLDFDRPAVAAYILTESIGSHLRLLAAEHDLAFPDLLAYFNREQTARDDQIRLMPHAAEALTFARDQGIQQFIYTHKGETTQAVLEDLGIAAYFTEVVTSASGFLRKPHPEAIDYLVAKYKLDKSRTYYIGDRLLDMQAAENAGIRSINLTQPDSPINQQITDLSHLPVLFA